MCTFSVDAVEQTPVRLGNRIYRECTSIFTFHYKVNTSGTVVLSCMGAIVQIIIVIATFRTFHNNH